jgi:hypothetical protein
VARSFFSFFFFHRHRVTEEAAPLKGSSGHETNAILTGSPMKEQHEEQSDVADTNWAGFLWVLKKLNSWQSSRSHFSFLFFYFLYFSLLFFQG